MYSHAADGGTRGIWVGVVAGGASGTTITVTWPGSYNMMTVAEITDTLTGTAGNTANATGANWIGVSATAGHLVAATAGSSNTTITCAMWCTNLAVGYPILIVPLILTYSTGAVQARADQDIIIAEIT
jgi:hypothetical protein